MDNLILEIFYKEIVPELKLEKGKIKIQDNPYYFPLSILTNEKKESSLLFDFLRNDDLSFDPPVLIIRDKENFDFLLVEYIKQQVQFLNEEENLRRYLVLCCGESIHNQIKYLLLLVWKNATSEDFVNPQIFLNRRIQFFYSRRYNDTIRSTIRYNSRFRNRLGSEKTIFLFRNSVLLR